MTDEMFVYKQDVREKKNTARSAHNRRTHTGKGGAVKFPSDYLSRKERNAMNGDVKVYRLNEPMKWNEFKEMPRSVQKQYVTALRQKFGVPDVRLAEMLGVSSYYLSAVFKQIGLAKGKGGYRKRWDVVGWTAWLNGIPAPAAGENSAEAGESEAAVEEQCASICEDICEDICETTKERAIPCFGTMNFEGSVDAALDTLRMLLGGATARITVTWATDADASKGGGADV